MIQPVLIIIGLALLILQISDHLQMWQVKEYRLDRLRAAWPSRDLRRRLNFFIIFLIAFFLIPIYSPLIIFSAYLILAVRRGIYKPRPTLKLITSAGLVIIITLLLLFAALLISAPFILALTIINLLAPFITAAAISLANLITIIRKQQYINRAQKNRQSLSLEVVGITGSFGKTSVKHFAAQLIPSAVISKQHRNSEYVIARDILQQLTPQTSQYILEMGAYKSGEIASLARLAEPTIGVITSIGSQHQAIFGSQSAILKAKWELARAVTAGILILNGDDPLLTKSALKHSGQIIWYGTSADHHISAQNIHYQSRLTNFDLVVDNQTFPISLSVIGQAALLNVLAAVAITYALKLPIENTVKKLPALKSYPRTMAIASGLVGSTIIDDSYSTGQASFINALNHLARFSSSSKLVVMVPIIELGSAAPAAHFQIGRALARVPARVFIYGAEYQADLARGFKNQGGRQLNFFTHPSKLKNQLTSIIAQDSVILLEGRVPDQIRDYLLDKK